MAQKQVFDEKDTEVLNHAISLFPSLELATYTTKLAKSLLQFPLKTHEDLMPIFKVSEYHEKFGNTGITYKLTLKFLSKKLFPITDEKDFLGKIFGALLYGERYHAFEKVKDKESVKKLVRQYPKHDYIKGKLYS